jgi:hypothetical protein
MGMNWDYLIIAAAIAASLTYLALRRAQLKGTNNVCGSSSCARCRQSPLHHGTRNDH